ncbi:MAG: NHL repeat-containing protein, partial [bacterium]|nr:NHL repeat-containing protein [bacterium]
THFFNRNSDLSLDTAEGVTRETVDLEKSLKEEDSSPGKAFRLTSLEFLKPAGKQPVIILAVAIPQASLVDVMVAGFIIEEKKEELIPGEVPWGRNAGKSKDSQTEKVTGELTVWSGFFAGGILRLEIALPFELTDIPGLEIRARQRVYQLVPIKLVGGMGRGEGQFFLPKGGFIDSSGNVFIADSGNDRVQFFDKRWKCRGMFGEFGWSFEEDTRFAGGQFNNPLSVCVERYVYVVDSDNYRVCRYDREGNFIDSFGDEGSGEGQFLETGGVAKDFDNNIFVSDTGNDRIQKFDSAGNFRKEIGFFGWGEGQLNAPGDVEIGVNDDIVVLDSGNGRVQIFNKYGSFIRALGSKGQGAGELKEPHGLDLVPEIGVLVADTGNDRIQLLSFHGGCLISFGSRGNGLGEFKEPWDVAVGPESDMVVVVETGNHRLQVLKLEERVDTVSRLLEADDSSTP